jgi:hypothetical protein
VLAFALAATSVSAQRRKKPPVEPHPGPITITEYSEIEWRPDDNHFRSPGHVRITLEDEVTHEKTVLIADDAEGSPTGDIIVKGKLRLERAEGVLTGRALTYRASSRSGIVLDARAQLANILLTGESIELLPDQSAKAKNASFTTCLKARPDYHITAREISVSQDQTVRAKHIGFYLGRTKILTLPSFKKSFRRQVSNPIPLPGYSKQNFLQFHFRNQLIETPSTAFDYDIRLSLRRTPEGEIAYERDLGHPDEDSAPPQTRRIITTEPLRTALESSPALLKGSLIEQDRRRTSLYALLTSNNFVYNRNRTDIRVSRLPEVGIAFRNLLNRQPPEAGPAQLSAFGTGFLSPANWFVNAELGAGYFVERPSHVEEARFGLRADAVSPMFHVSGPLYVRYGTTFWGSLYGNGNAYSIIAPEAELDVLLSRNTLIGAAYRYMQDFGNTPFLFDRRDVKKELRLRYGYLGGKWAYDTEIKYDLERVRAYDSVFSIRRRFDCMEVGFAYRTRDQGLAFILNLLPGDIGAHRQAATNGTVR